MSSVDNPWNVEGSWGGSMSIEVTVDQVLQSILAGALIFTAVALLAGIVEALRAKWWRRSRYMRLGVYSAICTILLAAALLSAYPLKNVSQLFLSTLSYVSIILLAELIPIVAIDRVRGAFICETPLLSDILKPLERKSEAKISGIRPSETASSDLGFAERDPSTCDAHEVKRPEEEVPLTSHIEVQLSRIAEPSEHGGRQTKPQSVNACWKTIVDPDYEMYCRWILRKGLFLRELEYREFVKLKEVVNQVLRGDVFGMASSKLGFEPLCLLARIDTMEDVEKLKRSYRRAFQKLRKFKLVSDRGRLMPRGVRLVKALKREGLIEKLREHPL